jgi:peptidoglycan/LPS O-acetylase OafA/YrhL
MQRHAESAVPIPESPASLPTPRIPERFHALDGLRALAMLLGIYLHGAVSFMTGMPRGIWPVQDPHAHRGFDVAFLYIHAFRMPLFIMLAGFFGRMVYQKLGGRGFLRQRFVRLIIPLGVGLAVCLPIMHALYLQGGGLFGPPPREIVFGDLRLEFPPTLTKHGPALFHLWFIYNLALLCLLATGVRVLADRVLSSAALDRVDGAMRWLVGSGWGAPALALITLPLFYQMRTWTIDTPPTLVPDPKMLLFYGLFFGFGWLLQRQPQLLAGLERRAGRQVLLGSVLLFPLLLVLMGLWGQTQGQGPALLKLAGLGTHSLLSWWLVLGFTGLALRYLRRPNAVMRYLSDGAYWMYLAHLPLIVWLQVLVAPWDMPGLVKFLLVTHLTIALLLPSYEYLVRYTFIGRVLNGPKVRRARKVSGSVGLEQGREGAVG